MCRPSVGPAVLVQLSARGSSGVMRLGHEVDLPRLRMSGTVPLLLGSRIVWLSRTGIVMLLRSDIDGSLGRL